MTSLRAKSSLLITSNFVSAALGYFSLLLIGRSFDPASYGLFSYAFGYTTILFVCTDLGLSYAHQKLVATGTDRNLAFGVMLRLRFGGAVVAACAVALLAGNRAAGDLVSSGQGIALLGAAVLFQFILVARSCLDATWLSEHKVRFVAAMRNLDSFLFLCFLVVAAFLAVPGAWDSFAAGLGGIPGPMEGKQSATTFAGAYYILGAYIVSRLVVVGAALGWAKKDLLRIGPWDPALAKHYFRIGLPMFAIPIMGTIQGSLDTVLLGYFQGAAEVGFYGMAQRFGAVALLPTFAVSAVLFPRFAQLHVRGETATGQALLERSQRLLLLATAPFCAFLFALPAESIALTVGTNYLPATSAVRALAIWALLNAAATPSYGRLAGEGRYARILWGALWTTSANILACLIFITPWGAGLGAVGGALALVTSASLGLAISFYYFGFGGLIGQDIRILGCAIAMAGGLIALRQAAPWAVQGLVPLALAGILSFAVYLGLLVLARVASHSDFADLRRMVA